MNKPQNSVLSEQEQLDLRWAYQHLEHPSLAARLSNLLATPIEEGLALLPKNWRRRLDKTAQLSIYQALKLSTRLTASKPQSPSSDVLYRVAATSAGAAGGFFGPLTLLAEVPLTTTLILSSIADVAQSEGEDLSQRESRIACVQVFALGGRTKSDEDTDLGYYGLRITLGLYFERDILEYAAGATGPHIPTAIQFVRSVASRFGAVISDKTAAQMVPIAGAFSGATLNLLFMKHYQDVARGHFIVRRLERDHGVEVIKNAYRSLADEELNADKEFSPVEGW
jgi:hypothetical protein